PWDFSIFQDSTIYFCVTLLYLISGENKIINRLILSVMFQNKMKTNNVIIVSGHAPGADTLGEKFAADHNLQCELHPADWNRHGRAAGPIRNEKMAEVSDALIAFWDGKSRGTRSMIEIARRKGLQVAVVKY
ncbi:MAG: DUF2493 domain-containing protein, partial [Acetobacter sp.]|nr:DUF2493 domain-containing protein [Acetobacter sp.]